MRVGKLVFSLRYHVVLIPTLQNKNSKYFPCHTRSLSLSFSHFYNVKNWKFTIVGVEDISYAIIWQKTKNHDDFTQIDILS